MERLRGERGVSPISTRLVTWPRLDASSAKADDRLPNAILSLLSLKRAVARSRIKSRAETYRGGISSPPKRSRSVAARLQVAECRVSHAEREAYDPQRLVTSSRRYYLFIIGAITGRHASEPTRAD